MTRHLSHFGALVLAGAVAFSLGTPSVAHAQRTATAGSGDTGQHSGGGDSGGRAVAVPRGDGGSHGGGSGGGHTSAPAPAPTPAPASSGATARSSAESSSGGDGQGRAVPRRGREDRPVVGNAIPRSEVPPFNGNIIIGGGGYPYYSYYPYYPWYYPGYYPWGYGGIGFGFSWYSPGVYGGGYGPYYGGGYYAHYDGAIRIKVQPSKAEVLVDGYYVGIVDEFDNPFQQLQLESGPHRIEVRADGYEPLSFEVRIVPGKTITYKADMKKVP